MLAGRVQADKLPACQNIPARVLHRSPASSCFDAAAGNAKKKIEHEYSLRGLANIQSSLEVNAARDGTTRLPAQRPLGVALDDHRQRESELSRDRRTHDFTSVSLPENFSASHQRRRAGGIS
jgi:hypothetical protein